MIDLLWCDGTWSKPGARSAVSEALRKALAGTYVRFVYVDYPAAFGPATAPGDLSPAESIRVGVTAMTRAIEQSPNRVVVGGYSQGAMIAVAVARDVLPRRPDLDVLAVATLGDPHQPVHAGRSGIAGALATPSQWPRFSVFAPGDPIADLSLGSPLRSIADMTEWMSIRDQRAQMNWAADVLDAVMRLQVQTWWQPWRWSDVNRAIDDARAYLGTKHTTDYITGGHVKRLALMVQGV